MGLKIFSAILLIAIVGEVHCDLDDSYYSSSMLECLKEHGIIVPSDYIQHVDIDHLSEMNKRVITCSTECSIKQESERTGKTMYQVVLDGLNEGRMRASNVDAMKTKLDTCANVVSVDRECKFVECLDLFNQPWKMATYNEIVETAGQVPAN